MLYWSVHELLRHFPCLFDRIERPHTLFGTWSSFCLCGPMTLRFSYYDHTVISLNQGRLELHFQYNPRGTSHFLTYFRHAEPFPLSCFFLQSLGCPTCRRSVSLKPQQCVHFWALVDPQYRHYEEPTVPWPPL